jgi:hypothetical protein
MGDADGAPACADGAPAYADDGASGAGASRPRSPRCSPRSSGGSPCSEGHREEPGLQPGLLLLRLPPPHEEAYWREAGTAALAALDAWALPCTAFNV